jgi:hypothetical protein
LGKRLKLNYLVLTLLKKYAIIIKKDFFKIPPKNFSAPLKRIGDQLALAS